jgi:hypothetical protein
MLNEKMESVLVSNSSTEELAALNARSNSDLRAVLVDVIERIDAGQQVEAAVFAVGFVGRTDNPVLIVGDGSMHQRMIDTIQLGLLDMSVRVGIVSGTFAQRLALLAHTNPDFTVEIIGLLTKAEQVFEAADAKLASDEADAALRKAAA